MKIKQVSKEVIYTNNPRVSCDGGEEDVGGHPKVYLEISAHNENYIVCPYCSKKFIFKSQ